MLTGIFEKQKCLGILAKKFLWRVFAKKNPVFYFFILFKQFLSLLLIVLVCDKENNRFKKLTADS